MFAAGCGILGEGTAFIVHLLTWRGPLRGVRVLVWTLEEEGAGAQGV